MNFISLNKEWTEEIRLLFKDEPSIHVECGNISNFSIENTCFVSPANSLGFMDGGIDLILSRKLLPGIEAQLKKRIADLNIQTSIGRPYLPIGSAIAVPYKESTYLIATPTMFLPHNVSATQNAYWSFYAALSMWKKLCIKKPYRLVVTSHCCGVGKMSAKDSAQQMKQAYDDFLSGKGSTLVKEYEDVLLFPNRDLEQPNNYDNMEIKMLYMSRDDYIQMLSPG